MVALANLASSRISRLAHPDALRSVLLGLKFRGCAGMMRTKVASQTVVYWSEESKKGLFVPSYYDPEDEYCERCEEAGLEECECYLDGDPADLFEQSLVGQSQDDYDGLSAEDIALIEHDVRESISMEDDLAFVRNTYAPISNVTR